MVLDYVCNSVVVLDYVCNSVVVLHMVKFILFAFNRIKIYNVMVFN